jgi:hypothetical protein
MDLDAHDQPVADRELLRDAGFDSRAACLSRSTFCSDIA